MDQPFRIRHAQWESDQAALRRVRELVFVREQNVPLDLEWDGIDPDCEHVLAEDTQGVAVGTGRLLPDGHIGRMAVLQNWRHRGVGSALLQRLIEIAAARGAREVILNAQTTALAFYERHGFTAEGEEFLDAGIVHRRMRKSLRSQTHGAVNDAGSSDNT
jgi:predicted GNAT family N-acyltransferase